MVTQPLPGVSLGTNVVRFAGRKYCSRLRQYRFPGMVVPLRHEISVTKGGNERTGPADWLEVLHLGLLMKMLLIDCKIPVAYKHPQYLFLHQSNEQPIRIKRRQAVPKTQVSACNSRKGSYEFSGAHQGFVVVCGVLLCVGRCSTTWPAAYSANTPWISRRPAYRHIDGSNIGWRGHGFRRPAQADGG